MKKLFHNQFTFPHSRNFSIVKELVHTQGIFLQSWKCSTNTKMFFKKILLLNFKFSINKKCSCKQKFFLWSRNFFMNKDSYTANKIFCKQSENVCNFSHNHRSKRFHTPKIIHTHFMTLVYFIPILYPLKT